MVNSISKRCICVLVTNKCVVQWLRSEHAKQEVMWLNPTEVRWGLGCCGGGLPGKFFFGHLIFFSRILKIAGWGLELAVIPLSPSVLTTGRWWRVYHRRPKIPTIAGPSPPTGKTGGEGGFTTGSDGVCVVASTYLDQSTREDIPLHKPCLSLVPNDLSNQNPNQLNFQKKKLDILFFFLLTSVNWNFRWLFRNTYDFKWKSLQSCRTLQSSYNCFIH